MSVTNIPVFEKTNVRFRPTFGVYINKPNRQPEPPLLPGVLIKPDPVLSEHQNTNGAGAQWYQKGPNLFIPG